MKSRFTVLVVIIIAFESIQCIDFTDCGTTSGKVTGITVSGCPTSAIACPFKTNTNETIDVNFKSEVNSNTATVKVWGIIGGVPIPFNLQPSNACGNWNINCPLSNGQNYDLKLSVPVLSYYPKIRVEVRVALLDSSNSKIFCQQFPAQITN